MIGRPQMKKKIFGVDQWASLQVACFYYEKLYLQNHFVFYCLKSISESIELLSE